MKCFLKVAQQGGGGRQLVVVVCVGCLRYVCASPLACELWKCRHKGSFIRPPSSSEGPSGCVLCKGCLGCFDVTLHRQETGVGRWRGRRIYLVLWVILASEDSFYLWNVK